MDGTICTRYLKTEKNNSIKGHIVNTRFTLVNTNEHFGSIVFTSGKSQKNAVERPTSETPNHAAWQNENVSQLIASTTQMKMMKTYINHFPWKGCCYPLYPWENDTSTMIFRLVSEAISEMDFFI